MCGIMALLDKQTETKQEITMSKRFDINYFINDDAVKSALEQYESGDVENAVHNMEIITRA